MFDFSLFFANGAKRQPKPVKKFSISRQGKKFYLYAHLSSFEKVVIGRYPSFEKACQQMQLLEKYQFPF